MEEVEPPVRRRVQVPGEMSLAVLHEVVQSAMGWTNSHLHEFEIDGRRYGMPDPDWTTRTSPTRPKPSCSACSTEQTGSATCMTSATTGVQQPGHRAQRDPPDPARTGGVLDPTPSDPHRLAYEDPHCCTDGAEYDVNSGCNCASAGAGPLGSLTAASARIEWTMTTVSVSNCPTGSLRTQ